MRQANPTTLSRPPHSAASQQRFGDELPNQLVVFWDIVRRHRKLVLSTMAVALALGALYYLRAPRQYESVTDVLIENKKFSGFQGTQDVAIYEKTIETHSSLIMSHKIVGRAIEDHELETLRCFDGEQSVRDTILDNLFVRQKEENTSILTISFRSRVAKDSRTVVKAIAKTYEKFLTESNERAKDNTANLIAHANDILSPEIDDLDKRIKEFQSQAPLIWREDGEAVNRHHERQIQLERARQEKMVERTELRARIDSIQSALAEGTSSWEAIYYEALGELKPETDDSDWRALKLAEQEQMAQRAAVREYASLLVGEYVKLLVRQSDLVDEYGEGHPDVESLSRQKSQVTLLLDRLVNNKMPLADILMPDEAVEAEEKDYVTIYIQLLNDRLDSLDTQIRQLDEEFKSEQVLAGEMQDFVVVDKALREQKRRKEELYRAVVGRLNEINVVSDYGGDTMTIITPAELGEQVAPRILHVAVASLFLGGAFGFGLAWLAEANEKTFHTASEIRATLQSPVVGCVPVVPKREQQPIPQFAAVDGSICSVHRRRSPVAEAIRGVRTNLYFSAAARDLKVIQVTSPLPGDGKSTLTANLAVSIANSGKRVLAIDCDFHRPMLSKLFGKSKECQFGLGAVIAGRAEASDAILATDVPNLFLLPAHEKPANPSELLTTREFEDLLASLKGSYDFVLVDTPPVLAVTDPCAVAARADGVLVTFRIRKGVQNTARRCVELLEDVGSNVLGVVVNGVDDRHGISTISNYGYGYTGYGDQAVTNGSTKPSVTIPTS